MTKNDEARYRDAMRDLIGERFGAVWKAVPASIEGREGNAVKDVRVASRRLRAAMDVAEGCFPKSWYEPLHDAAKEITGALGEVRDREVLIEFLRGERSSTPAGDGAGIDRLIERVERERDDARERMVEFLTSLENHGAAAESVRRFGKAASPETVDSE